MASSGNKACEEGLYFPVEAVKFEDLTEMAPNKQRSDMVEKKEEDIIRTKRSTRHHTQTGKVVMLNKKRIVLFRFKDKVYALDEKCPHMGGPLHLGDIEEVGGAKHPCVVCPWHNWKYSMLSGEVRAPTKGGIRVNVYPVRVAPDGQLFVMFESFATDFFNGVEDF